MGKYNVKVSVAVRVPAENRWHGQVRVTSEEFNKETPYKGVTGHSVTSSPTHPPSPRSKRWEGEQSLDALDVALDRTPTAETGVTWWEGSRE